jgi:hypothetical protein
MALQEAIFAGTALLIAATLQGFIGFGFGIAAMTSLTLSQDLVHASGVVNLTGLLLTGTAVWRLRGELLFPVYRRIVPGLLVGVAAGVFALAHLELGWLVRALGVTVIGIAAWNLIAPSLKAPHNRTVDLVVGLAAGGLGGAFNTGGPPLVAHIYSIDASPNAHRATVQALFATIGLARLPVAIQQGLMTEAVWREAALAAPFVLAGLALGLWLGQRVSPERFRRIAWIALGLMGFVLLLG